MQTAVEWLVDKLKSTRNKYMGFKNTDIDYQEIIKQAKETAVEFLLGQMFMNDILFSKTVIDQALEMEKEQRKQEYLKGMKDANELRIEQEKQNL